MQNFLDVSVYDMMGVQVKAVETVRIIPGRWWMYRLYHRAWRFFAQYYLRQDVDV